MQSQFPNLFSPIQLGHLTAKNRIVIPPHGTGYSENGYPAEQEDKRIKHPEQKLNRAGKGKRYPLSVTVGVKT